MVLNGVGLENFKAFKERNDLEFRKLNVFLGPNSSGKSSFLKALMLLNNTIRSSEEEPALQLSEDIGDYKSITYGNQNGKLKFIMSFSYLNRLSEQEEQIFKKNNRNIFIQGLLSSKQSEQVYLHELEDYIQNHIVTYSEAMISSVEITIKQTEKKPNVVDELILSMTNGDQYLIKMRINSFFAYKGTKEFSQPNLFTPYKFLFKLNEKKFEQSEKDEIDDIMQLTIAFSHLESQLNSFFKQFLRIEPFRFKPERTEHIANFKYNTVGSDGRNTVSAVMGLNQRNDKGPSNQIKDDINFWLREFSLAQEVVVKELSDNQYSLNIVNKHTGIKSNIVDVGVGTSQLLPIILETFISPRNSVLAIEEPETHIHPNAQAKLAIMFTRAIEQNKRFFIETHSMYFIQQLQILIAEGELETKDLGIYYFHQDEKGSHVKHLEMLPNGQFKNSFPAGFFDVAFDLSKKLMKAARQKRD